MADILLNYLSVLGGFSLVFGAWLVVSLRRQKKKGQHSIFLEDKTGKL